MSENTTAAPPLWYLGVDVAGASNTWCVGLLRRADGAKVAWGPHRRTLEQIVGWARGHHVLAAAIDAQLTGSLSDENGFRDADRALRRLLPPERDNWVASFNSLMAVPLRGRMLAEALSPFTGTIIETHPRVALWSALGNEFDEHINCYKRKPPRPGNAALEPIEVATPDRQSMLPVDALKSLAARWAHGFGVAVSPPHEIVHEGALDAVVAATVAMLYHREPERLCWLQPSRGDVRGHGPFVVPRSARIPQAVLVPPERRVRMDLAAWVGRLDDEGFVANKDTPSGAVPPRLSPELPRSSAAFWTIVQRIEQKRWKGEATQHVAYVAPRTLKEIEHFLDEIHAESDAFLLPHERDEERKLRTWLGEQMEDGQWCLVACEL